MENDRISAFWQEYLDTLPPDSPARAESYEAEYFCDTPQFASELGALVAGGTKTATCSALWEWEADGDSLPESGAKCVILNGRNEPLCIIETVEVRPYNEVDVQFAYDEGEGDRSLQHWRDARWRFFTRSLAGIGKEPTPDMPLVCERFRVVYRPTQMETR